jgi:hypothetical protein
MRTSTAASWDQSHCNYSLIMARNECEDIYQLAYRASTQIHIQLLSGYSFDTLGGPDTARCIMILFGLRQVEELRERLRWRHGGVREHPDDYSVIEQWEINRWGKRAGQALDPSQWVDNSYNKHEAINNFIEWLFEARS